MNLIDKDKLVKTHAHFGTASGKVIHKEYYAVADVENAEVVEGVPVIRCRNCKYFVAEEHLCLWWRSEFIAPDGDGFCSDAERKQDNETDEGRKEDM